MNPKMYKELVKIQNEFSKFIYKGGHKMLIANQPNKVYVSFELPNTHNPELMFYDKIYLNHNYELEQAKEIKDYKNFKPIIIENYIFKLVLKPRFYRLILSHEDIIDISTFQYSTENDENFIKIVEHERHDFLFIYDFDIQLKTNPEPKFTDTDLINLFEGKKKTNNKKNKKLKKQSTTTTTTRTTTTTTTTTDDDDDDIPEDIKEDITDDVKQEDITDDLEKEDINQPTEDTFYHLKISFNRHINFSTSQMIYFY